SMLRRSSRTTGGTTESNCQACSLAKVRQPNAVYHPEPRTVKFACWSGAQGTVRLYLKQAERRFRPSPGKLTRRYRMSRVNGKCGRGACLICSSGTSLLNTLSHPKSHDAV